ncbi:MAG TPA: protein-S-isoprenylcysteine methyltransferase [Sphingomicrobium sp.]
MYHDTLLAKATQADPRPKSAVSTGVGVAGLVGLLAWIALARTYGLDGPYAALVNLAACALPMLLYSVVVDKVHLNPTTGIDWAHIKPWRETIDISLTKLAGLWATWGGIALLYAVGRFYWQGGFTFSMWCFQVAAPVLFAASIPYILYFDRRAVEPKDGCYTFGAWLMGLADGKDHEAIYHHLRAWAVKAFFLAFMLAIVPPGFSDFVRGDTSRLLQDPVALSGWLITLMFSIDVAFATVGYMLTMRPLDAHIRTANPYAAGWMSALICYPPFVLMAEGGPFDYHPGTADWTQWFAGHPIILAVTGVILVALTAIYAWSTVSFGFRFSNLTHRGILTHGPYALSKHPAYLSKNLFWWISTIPFLSTGSLTDAARATILMGVVAGIYYWRARTEERHLGEDPVYQEYAAWMARNAPVPRFFAWLKS